MLQSSNVDVEFNEVDDSDDEVDEITGAESSEYSDSNKSDTCESEDAEVERDETHSSLENERKRKVSASKYIDLLIYFYGTEGTRRDKTT